MPNLTPDQKIQLYKNIFRARENVFAMHWQKADKSASGYTPVCLNEWKRGTCLKLNRGRCRDCESKKYAKFSEQYIDQHLRGYKTYGIYPLLEDNTSYFIVADFDGKNWEKDAVKFIRECRKQNLFTYLERSRSGSGGHVWLFFEDKYPAYKSRNIAINILKDAKIIDQFEKEDSYDRLFPNQDTLSGKGLGNLIALPLQGESRKQDNTVFIDLKTLTPFEDQWEVLNKIKKISISKLDELYKNFNQELKPIKSSTKNCLVATIKEKIFISKSYLPKILINFLKDELNFVNSEYLIKKRMGVSTYKMERYFKLVETNEDNIALPRGFLNQLVNFLNEKEIKFELKDERTKLKSIKKFESGLKLFDYQKEAIENIVSQDQGILVAPPGAGKTIMGLELISRIKQPALILVHKRQIFNQWLERIENFINIPKREIGQFSSNKKKVGDKITIAMVQTLSRMENIEEIKDKFGLIIVDECHHMPAKMFRGVITKFNPYYFYGLTATPERKNNDVKLIFVYLGDILHEIKSNQVNYTNQKTKTKNIHNNTKIIIQKTKLEVPFKVKTDNFQVLSKIIVYDSNRNQQIISDIKKEANKKKKCLVLTERKDHVEVLSYYLKREYEIVTLTGDLTEKQKREKIKQIEADNFQILIATGQLIGEGTDFPNLNCLFLVYPFSFTGKLTQYIGRIQRGNNQESVIYDYRDVKIEYLERFFKKRSKYYEKEFGLII